MHGYDRAGYSCSIVQAGTRGPDLRLGGAPGPVGLAVDGSPRRSSSG